ncbi:cholecystokinin receptor type A-like [Mizuhopecten yessoensis]|uniref:Orexin receptor type 2 n=1 Tax=Mizuhopecten yessoensis TaxID=6573 RepID=A0A210Q3V0_MIZYE|nr:cholecystokinin receptor type A-like [Mizuhopecten yessoensis]OWF43382.1 Orexin receptor type 2 [Mizuhopecten yessoensis]
MDNSTVPEDILGQLNSHRAMNLLPNTIMLFIYIVLGILGNSAIIYIYKFRFRQTSDERFFIPYLAGIDAMASVICSSANLIVNFNPVLYTNAALCKSFFMLSQFAASSSSLMLTIIAVQRFQLICRPFKPRMTLRNKRLCVLCTLLVVFLLSIPSVFITGIAPITNKSLNVTGYVCASVKVMGSSVFPFVYNLLVLTMCVGNLFVLCTLYVMIGKTIYGRARYRRSMKLKPIGESSSPDGLSESCTGKTSTISETQSSTPPSASHGKFSRKMRTTGNRLSIMFLVVTLVYILCYAPTIIAIVRSSLDKNDWKDKSTTETLGFRTANTLYIINNIVNPIIYGLFDPTLRKEIIAWLSNMF